MATPTTTPQDLVTQAAEFTRSSDGAPAIDKLLATAGGDRVLVEAARDRVAAQLHERTDDFEATATLTLLNQALARIPRTDPLDWRVRRAHHRKP